MNFLKSLFKRKPKAIVKVSKDKIIVEACNIDYETKLLYDIDDILLNVVRWQEEFKIDSSDIENNYKHIKSSRYYSIEISGLSGQIIYAFGLYNFFNPKEVDIIFDSKIITNELIDQQSTLRDLYKEFIQGSIKMDLVSEQYRFILDSSNNIIYKNY